MRMREDERKGWKKEDETAFYLLLLKPELSLESFKTICCGGYSVFVPIFLGYFFWLRPGRQ